MLTHRKKSKQLEISPKERARIVGEIKRMQAEAKQANLWGKYGQDSSGDDNDDFDLSL